MLSTYCKNCGHPLNIIQLDPDIVEHREKRDLNPKLCVCGCSKAEPEVCPDCSKMIKR